MVEANTQPDEIKSTNPEEKSQVVLNTQSAEFKPANPEESKEVL